MGFAKDAKSLTGGADLTHPRANAGWAMKAFVAAVILICIILAALWAVKTFIQPAASKVAANVPVLQDKIAASTNASNNANGFGSVL